MLLNLTVYDNRNAKRGSVPLTLDFGSKEWSIPMGQQQGWSGVGYTAPPKGSFELKGGGILWLWDQRPGQHNTVIFWNCPESESDTAHLAGQARIFDPKDPSFKEGKILWAVDTTATTALSPIRQRVRDLIAKIPFQFDPNYKPNFPNGPPSKTPAYTQGNTVSNCGEFPGWIMKNIGGANLPADTFLKFHDKWGVYAITAPMVAWDVWATKLQSQPSRKGKGPIWVPYTPGVRPKTGDFYVLLKEINKKTHEKGFAHVGVIIDASGAEWTTADCGQGDNFAGCYQKRKFDEAAGTLTLAQPGPPHKYGPDGGTRLLKGWVDLDNLVLGWTA